MPNSNDNWFRKQPKEAKKKASGPLNEEVQSAIETPQPEANNAIPATGAKGHALNFKNVRKSFMTGWREFKYSTVRHLAEINPDSRTYRAFAYVHRHYKKVTSRTLLMKILFTLAVILLFRIAASITMPAVSITQAYKDSVGDTQSFLGVFDLLGGGTLRNFSIMALGISPYITASMIVQVLTSEAFPPLNKLSKSGPAGKRKINILTRVITFVFALAQSIFLIRQLDGGLLQLQPGLDTPLVKWMALPLILVATSMFALFLGEQITNKGVGNGTSLIIFSGIAVNLPAQFSNAYYELVDGNRAQSQFVGVVNLVFYIIAFLVLVYIIGVFYQAERRIPIQQTGAGLITDKAQMSALPIKLNTSGVMPVIYSLALAALPVTFAQFADRQDEGRIWIENNMRLTQPIGLGIYIAITFFFTLVLGLITFNPYQVADGFKKNGTFIPGVRPGEETENYLTGVVIRLSLFSAFYMSAISAIQYIEQIIGLSANVSYGGTSLIIIVSVAIETISQVRARDKTQKIARARQNALASKEASGGLLW